MNTQEMYIKFTQGFNWNAILYMVQKGTSTFTIMLLYNILHTNMFSLYGNINSITFLLLLWLDFGFHKTVPLFALKYAQSPVDLNQFIKRLLTFKIIVLIASVPFYLFFINKIVRTLQLSNYYMLAYISGLFFITEGLVSLVRLIYHSYFLHRIYNKISAATLLLELGLSLIAIKFFTDHTIILALFLSKITANCLILAIAWYKKSIIYEQHITKESQQTNHKITLDKQFILHAMVMYGSTTIKSLSERNFLLPLFTTTFGPATANMFKIANDGALFFYRSIIKTIGTLDTSLFSYTLTTHQHNKTWQIAISKLTHKIGALVIPFLGIVYIIYYNKQLINYDHIILDMFLIITLELLIEVLFSPFERILEVKKEYILLAYAYVPYLLVITIILCTQTMTYIGIVNSLLLIHGVRLVSTFIIAFTVYIKYSYTFPFYFIGFLLGLVMPCIYIVQRSIECFILIYNNTHS